jgi:hypothetical protein
VSNACRCCGNRGGGRQSEENVCYDISRNVKKCEKQLDLMRGSYLVVQSWRAISVPIAESGIVYLYRFQSGKLLLCYSYDLIRTIFCFEPLVLANGSCVRGIGRTFNLVRRPKDRSMVNRRSPVKGMAN